MAGRARGLEKGCSLPSSSACKVSAAGTIVGAQQRRYHEAALLSAVPASARENFPSTLLLHFEQGGGLPISITYGVQSWAPN